jgi:hypothetical protein
VKELSVPLKNPGFRFLAYQVVNRFSRKYNEEEVLHQEVKNADELEADAG